MTLDLYTSDAVWKKVADRTWDSIHSCVYLLCLPYRLKRELMQDISITAVLRSKLSEYSFNSKL